MEIPRQRIQDTLDLVKNIESLKYIHYRDYYKHIDHENFQICTKTDFKKIDLEGRHVKHMWNILIENNKNEIIYQHKSRSKSEYLILKNGTVYRMSDHWGAVASCEWTLDGKGELRMSVFEYGDWEIGVSNLNEFKEFRRKNDRRVDIMINPLWINQIIVVEPLKNLLYLLKKDPGFKELPVEDKRLIGETFGHLEKELRNTTSKACN